MPTSAVSQRSVSADGVTLSDREAQGERAPTRLTEEFGAGVAGLAGPVIDSLLDRMQDLWQHRHHFVAGTRWWPPFCLVVDWVAAAILVLLIATGVHFHH